MCRNIKPLFNFSPDATDEEIRAASLQFVRKISGMSKPTGKNEIAFQKAVEEITENAKSLFANLETSSKPKNREVEAEKARLRNEKRFGKKII